MRMQVWGGFDDADGLSVCHHHMRVYYAAHPGEFVVEISPDRVLGGEHIRMIVTETGAKIEYDCALGTIDEALLLDEDDNFEAKGIHVYERGGPIRLGEPPPERHSALYRGTVDGTQMRLTVTLLETGKEVGTFLLGLGRPPLIEKCL